MRAFKRDTSPEFLAIHAEKWNNQWKTLKARNPSATFNWYTLNGKPVNQLLENPLSNQTQRHCAYCDAFPPGPSDKSIDHFRPKGNPAYFHLAYHWENLYWACADCQKCKGDQFSALLLAPDSLDFYFSRYFTYNYRSHEITANLSASAEDQEKAQTTITILGLNDASRITSRRHAWERVQFSTLPIDSEDTPYRFIFD